MERTAHIKIIAIAQVGVVDCRKAIATRTSAAGDAADQYGAETEPAQQRLVAGLISTLPANAQHEETRPHRRQPNRPATSGEAGTVRR